MTFCGENQTADRIRRLASNPKTSGRESERDILLEAWREQRQALRDACDDPAVRRLLRGKLLEALTAEEAADLARELLAWQEDYDPGSRDRTTRLVVESLWEEDLHARLAMLARSNASGSLWERLAREGSEQILTAARTILAGDDVLARETTLHMLVLDPYGPQYLTEDQQDELLLLTLGDPDPEIRGLAAEVVAADMPQKLLELGESAASDSSERLRMAFWRVRFAHQPDETADAAGAMALDSTLPQSARRTALLAMAENRATRTVAPVLQELLTGEDEILAEDAALLMWRRHRAPDIASAAAESSFPRVRELAERLLHPERGSPAAGGSRPGDPTRTTDILDQISPNAEWRGPEQDEPKS